MQRQILADKDNFSSITFFTPENLAHAVCRGYRPFEDARMAGQWNKGKDFYLLFHHF